MCEENLLGNTSCRIYGLRKEIGLCNGSQLGTYYIHGRIHAVIEFSDFAQRLKNS